MRFAYADPPYLGLAAKLYREQHPAASDYDQIDTHIRLIHQLATEFDGFALSLHVPSLRAILPHVPLDVRICAWVKPFASYKKNVWQAYAWEPVLVRPARKLTGPLTVPDFVVANIALRRGLPGAKPEGFAWWLFAFAGLERDDEFVDLYPGTGGIGRAWDAWTGQLATWA